MTAPKPAVRLHIRDSNTFSIEIKSIRRRGFKGALYVVKSSRVYCFFNQFMAELVLEKSIMVTPSLDKLYMISCILLVALLRVSWRLSLLLLALTPVAFLLAMGFRRIARRVTRAGFRVLAEVNTAIQEAVTGISVAKNFRQEAAMYSDFCEINDRS